MIFHIFIVLFAFYLYKYYKNKYFYWRNQGVPVQFPIPIINDYYYHLIYPMHEANLKCLHKYGPIWVQFQTSTYQQIFICEPKLIKEILFEKFKLFNGRMDASIFSKYFRKALLVRDETNGWKHIRQTITPLFTTGKLKNLYSNLHKPIGDQLDHLERKMCGKYHLDNFNSKLHFKKVLWNVTLHLFFSIELNSFSIKTDDFIEKFLTALPFGTLDNILAIITPECIARQFEIIPIDKQTYHYFVELCLNCIEERKKEGNQSKYNDLIQLLIQTGLPTDEVVAQCFALFLGGFDSVSSVCGYALYELALRPDIQDRLYDELKVNFPGDSLDIEYDRIFSSTYLEAFVKEVLRKHPAISKIFRKALDDIELNDIKIKKDTFVSIPIYAIHHYEKYWPDPYRFDPTRFLNKQPEFGTYLPFGDGSRQCIAKRLAELEVRYFLITFLKRYEVYRTEHTKIPLQYFKFNFLLNCENVVIGIRKRNIDE